MQLWIGNIATAKTKALNPERKIEPWNLTIDENFELLQSRNLLRQIDFELDGDIALIKPMLCGG